MEAAATAAARAVEDLAAEAMGEASAAAGMAVVATEAGLAAATEAATAAAKAAAGLVVADLRTSNKCKRQNFALVRKGVYAKCGSGCALQSGSDRRCLASCRGLALGLRCPSPSRDGCVSR